MNIVTTEFSRVNAKPWNGRYARVMGNSGVFHLQSHNGQLWPVIIWKRNDNTLTCPAIHSPAAVHIADAVAQVKRQTGAYGGGSFIINEYGQIIVPASDGGGNRFLAGRLKGTLLFENPLMPNKAIDLADDTHLQNGDPWELPYIGVRYNLHRNGYIYFYQTGGSGGRSIHPPQQDYALIQAIRKVRPYGAVRIIVTLGGLVLTKVPFANPSQSEQSWQPVFVGSINPNFWFKEE